MTREPGFWYERGWIAALLAPLAWLYCTGMALRRQGYRWGWFASWRARVPVIVVGNVSVGGTGKTPLVIALVELLRRHGWRPAVVSRGYGGRARNYPQQVRPDCDPRVVGDEALLIAARAGCPVAVAPRRPAAVAALLDHEAIDIVVCDDGLQHLALARDIDIAVVDGVRWYGNGRCLPAGPLRESFGVLATVDAVVVNGIPGPDQYGMRLTGQTLHSLDGARTQPLAALAGRTVHAVAGIGHPARFFEALRRAGLTVVEHAFSDHHPFAADEIAWGDGHPVVMTEKDAVKCRRLPLDPGAYWVLPVQAELDARFEKWLLHKLETKTHGSQTT